MTLGNTKLAGVARQEIGTIHSRFGFQFLWGLWHLMPHPPPPDDLKLPEHRLLADSPKSPGSSLSLLKEGPGGRWNMVSLWSSLGEEKDGRADPGWAPAPAPAPTPVPALSSLFSKCHGPTTIWDPFFVEGGNTIFCLHIEQHPVLISQLKNPQMFLRV